ncbi:MAG TPA: UvrD-helicase domain-containing protein [Lacunisphaera sp.]|nr:UvrD-helicase domain-containing protein [Lacunisphaera sp.]
MSEHLPDQEARDRFRDERGRNFAVCANAGSGKTTAISERLAALALTPDGAAVLRKTAVVTFTRKAAAQISQRARAVLVRRLRESGRADLAPLDHLERAFFGTIHSFCLLLAQRYGQTLGVNLNPAVAAEDDADLWEEFLEQDAMQFDLLPAAHVEAFLRHAPLESVFDLARRLDLATARRFAARKPASRPPEPAAAVLDEIRGAKAKAGRGAEALRRNQEAVERWRERFRAERAFLPLPRPEGTAANIRELYARFFAPVKEWLAESGAVLAAELALRYRTWRFDRGVQTYADQVDAALAVLQDEAILERIRAEDWHVLLDEAQDTDPQQFAVLVEVTRPKGAPLHTWPGAGPGPRPGRFCLVGDGQQAIYGSRADIRNFLRHVDAFARGDGGELLKFDVTFRSPHRVIEFLDATLPAAFGPGREFNLGLAPAKLLQVPFVPLVAGPANVPGALGLLPLPADVAARGRVGRRLAAEVRTIAAWLKSRGPAGVGARTWGEVCLLAPRNDWLVIAQKELEAAGLKTALQMRRNRNADHPVYAWVCGLLAVAADPENTFEWTGVLREVFGVSDARIAAELRATGSFRWDEPEAHAEPVRSALATLQPLIGRMDAEGEPLARFAADLAAACGLEAKARAVDPGGALADELERLLAAAAELGLAGTGPRGWLQELLAAREEGRPAGKPDDDAINLLTSHSAKGLEWPVVIPLGLWRKIGRPPEAGLRWMKDTVAGDRVYFDGESVPIETRDARERERLRELVRLLYVTVTRARRVLVLPWGGETMEAQDGSFARLWGSPFPRLAALVPPETGMFERAAAEVPGQKRGETDPGQRRTAAAFPVRVLPHQLSIKPDAVRGTRHDAEPDQPAAVDREDPLDYGTWWHETLEFLPWSGNAGAVAGHLDAALVMAGAKGFEPRAREELQRLQDGELWRDLRTGGWEIMTEVSVLAPLTGAKWVDGVIDLVARRSASRELMVIDWKTNRGRAGERSEAWLERLAAEYEPQLSAYGACLAHFFAGYSIKLGIYATGAGATRFL